MNKGFMERYSGTLINFKCLRCGECCKNLIHEVEGMLKGPSLWPDEIHLFLKNTISPSYGIGKTSDSVNGIYMYQLNIDDCPHLTTSKECKIYDKRPLSCRVFPLIGIDLNLAFLAKNRDCNFINQTERKLGSLDFIFTPKFFSAPDCWKALNRNLRKIFNKQIDARLMGLHIFSYNLKTQKWERMY